MLSLFWCMGRGGRRLLEKREKEMGSRRRLGGGCLLVERGGTVLSLGGGRLWLEKGWESRCKSKGEGRSMTPLGGLKRKRV